MAFDFNKFRKQTAGIREINPIKIYDGLSKSKVNDLWRGQYLALEELNDNRALPHVVLNLNTGGGKTVIGLLAGLNL
jgi:CRISPR/Cas system-associated endonuclease/helicase Cas3